MIKPYFLDQLPDEVAQHPAATLHAIAIFFVAKLHQTMHPDEKGSMQHVMLAAMRQLEWTHEEMLDALRNLKVLVQTFPQLETLELIIPTQKAGLA